MDIANLAPQIAALIGVQPSTLVLLIMILTTAANVTTRLIPDDATGALGVLRKLTAIIGAHVSSRVTSGVTVTDVAKAALETPPITGKVAEEVVGALGNVLAPPPRPVGSAPPTRPTR